MGGEHSLKNFSSLALTVCDLWYFEDFEEKADSLNYEAVCRTAPATPGLLISGHKSSNSIHIEND